MYLFQYWDNPKPPEEVAGWIDGFRSRNPEFDHVLFDRTSARAFIAEHFGAREAAAFDLCAVPAMQADFIRLCAILKHGGVYVDADNQSLKPLVGLIEQAEHGLMFTWTGLVNNGFLWFREPQNAYLQACLKLTVDNIEHRRFTIEFTSTGPGIFNAVRLLADPASAEEVHAAFDNPICASWGFRELMEHAREVVEVDERLRAAYASITLMHALAASPWIGADQPAYKETDRHWVNWSRPIYTDAT